MVNRLAIDKFEWEDLKHFSEGIFDWKRISPNLNPNPKAQKTFLKTKCRHFSSKCPDTTIIQWQVVLNAIYRKKYAIIYSTL